MRTNGSRIALLLLPFAAAACEFPRPGGTEGTEGAAPAAGMPGVPAAIAEAEGLSEMVQDDILLGDWAAAEQRAEQLVALRNPIDRQGPWGAVIGEYDRNVDSLTTRVARRDTLGALVAANNVSRAVVSMMQSFPTPFPVAVGYMDVAAREAIYAARQGRWDDADSAAGELQRNHAEVTDHIREVDPALDARVRQHIEALRAAVEARDAVQVGAVGGALLEDADAIEMSY